MTVLGVEREKMNGQYIFQSKKSGLASDQKKQKWKYDNQQRLILTDDNDKEYALVSSCEEKSLLLYMF
jgi:hypothetical protein